ncbi:hypothetical protein DFP72DRAFT_1075546 [Ephemerocybe angulata]|uniref:Uncharacterized protein n=1 Tax=Ephemerocybe angulata TaxID=980116 RepID=A0A8H6LZ18_9AGAR|nr:hypothetical protein DFP72DRAFT_1075546 [Tulosesus angulatus]
MKLTESILLALSALATCSVASVHTDYDNLVERMESVDVPFQHSLRGFLEEAASAHRRALSSRSFTDDDDLEARAFPVQVAFRNGEINFTGNKDGFTGRLFDNQNLRADMKISSVLADAVGRSGRKPEDANKYVLVTSAKPNMNYLRTLDYRYLEQTMAGCLGSVTRVTFCLGLRADPKKYCKVDVITQKDEKDEKLPW